MRKLSLLAATGLAMFALHVIALSVVTGAFAQDATQDATGSDAPPQGSAAGASRVPAPAPATPHEVDAFGRAFRGLLPLTPDMIRSARQQLDDSQKAASEQPNPNLKPALTSQAVSLEPGAAPPTLQLAPGRASVLTFFDVTGAPWPIEAYVSGNPQQFDVLAPIKGGSSLTVTPLTAYPVSNLVVFLTGEDVPVMFDIRAGTTTVDYRRNINVNGLGPNAIPSIIQGSPMPVNGEPQLMRFLDGVPPEGARRVEVLGGDASAWRWNGELYLRTSMTLVSPAWTASVRSAGGMMVYQLADSPVLLASVEGRVVELMIQ